MAIKKDLKYYLNLKWSYTIEQETENGKDFYIIRVNELPGVITDAESIEKGMLEIKDAIKAALTLYLKDGDPIPEPLDKELFKGNITYRTTRERHYLLAKTATNMHKSISKTIDLLIDEGIKRYNPRVH